MKYAQNIEKKHCAKLGTFYFTVFINIVQIWGKKNIKIC